MLSCCVIILILDLCSFQWIDFQISSVLQIDAVAKSRDGKHRIVSNDEREQTLNQLLTVRFLVQLSFEQFGNFVYNKIVFRIMNSVLNYIKYI